MPNPFFNPAWLQLAPNQDPNLVRQRLGQQVQPVPIPSLPEQSFTLGQGIGAGLGAASLGLQAFGMSQQVLGLPQVTPQSYDPNVQPTYNLGQVYNQAAFAKPQGATGGEILGGVGQGAALGTQIAPGIGTAVGAVVGGLASLIGGGARKRRQEREKERAMRGLAEQQQAFNRASGNFVTQQNYMEDYIDQLNRQQANLSTIPRTYSNLF
jgi:hypothetical protein